MDVIEKPEWPGAPSTLAIMGRYVLVPEIFEVLANTPPGRNGEIQLTDAIRGLLQHKAVYGYEFEGERYDAGTPLSWLETTIALALKDPLIAPQLKDYLQRLLDRAT